MQMKAEIQSFKLPQGWLRVTQFNFSSVVFLFQ
jgi:hypothetical protein